MPILSNPSQERLTAIYVLAGPDGIVRYVGKTVNPVSRSADHQWPAHRTKSPVARWVRKLRLMGQRPVLSVIEWTKDWESREVFWIAFYRAIGAKLLNIAAGGFDMAHVTEARGRYPNYDWAMKFCGRRKNRKLAMLLKHKASMARQFGRMHEFDAVLMTAILDGYAGTA